MVEQEGQSIKRVVKVVRRKIPDVAPTVGVSQDVMDDTSSLTSPSFVPEPVENTLTDPAVNTDVAPIAPITPPLIADSSSNIEEHPYDPAEDPDLATVPKLEAPEFEPAVSDVPQPQYFSNEDTDLNTEPQHKTEEPDVSLVSKQQPSNRDLVSNNIVGVDPIVTPVLFPNTKPTVMDSTPIPELIGITDNKATPNNEPPAVSAPLITPDAPKVEIEQEVKLDASSILDQSQALNTDETTILEPSQSQNQVGSSDLLSNNDSQASALPIIEKPEMNTEQPAQLAPKAKLTFTPPPVVNSKEIPPPLSTDTSVSPHKFTQVPRDQDFKPAVESASIDEQSSKDTKDAKDVLSFLSEDDNFAERLNLPKKLLSTKFMVMIMAGIFLFGLLIGVIVAGGSSEPAKKNIMFTIGGIVQNPEVPGGRARCGATEMSQGCVLYIQNNKTREYQAKDFYPLVMQLTGMQRFQIETGNMRYAYKVIKPGWIAQFNIPPSTK